MIPFVLAAIGGYLIGQSRKKYAQGGVLEHGLRKGDKILTENFNYAGIVNEDTAESVIVDIETGKREKMADGGEVGWKFVDEGDGVEYEVWKKDGEYYRIPIDRVGDSESGEPEIERFFEDATILDQDDSPNDPREIVNTMDNKYKGKDEYEIRKALQKKGYEYLGHQSLYDDKKFKIPKTEDWKSIFRNDFATTIYVSDSLKKFYVYQGGE